MEKYEILKLNYLRKIRKDKTFFERMVELQEQEETKEIADIVLHPENERQLILAESFHTFFNARDSIYVVLRDRIFGIKNLSFIIADNVVEAIFSIF